METVYTDNAQGAVEFIIKESVLRLSERTTCIPDPVVAGVWKITNLIELDNSLLVSAIIYMAGYPDPFKCIRQTNDFEVIEQ